MKKEKLIQMSHDEVLSFIRKRLSFEDDIDSQLRHIDRSVFEFEHRRFLMSGYESKTGECTLFNLAILNEFADLGIYDYTDYLFLDFYKGGGTLYYRYFQTNENLQECLSGYGTTDIIYEIFKKTIFSGKRTRRRD